MLRNAKTERDRYFKSLMDKYNIFNIIELRRTATADEVNKMDELQLNTYRQI